MNIAVIVGIIVIILLLVLVFFIVKKGLKDGKLKPEDKQLMDDYSSVEKKVKDIY